MATTLDKIVPNLDPVEILETIQKHITKENCKILDIGSGKPPKCALMFANWFENSTVNHYRKEALSEKESRRFQKDNLKITTSPLELGSNYDLATAVLSLHPPDNPSKGINQAYSSLSPGGKIVIWDYDLTYFTGLIKDNQWSQQEALQHFSKQIFTSANECAFLGLKNGEPYTHKKIHAEPECMENHTKVGLETFEGLCEDAGFKKLGLIKEMISTPWGNQPKTFAYFGEKAL